MKKKALKLGAMALAAGLALPLAADAAEAAEADLQVRIDKLTQQMEELKGQVKQVEDKSLGKWLQIGGSYQFRIDSFAWEDMYEGGRHVFWRNNEIAGEAAIMHAYLNFGLFHTIQE